MILLNSPTDSQIYWSKIRTAKPLQACLGSPLLFQRGVFPPFPLHIYMEKNGLKYHKILNYFKPLSVRALCYTTYMDKIDTQLISAELDCIGQKLTMFTSYARKIQWQDDTRRATCDADDVVSTCIEKLATKLNSGKLELAKTVKHARARFMLIIQGYLRDLRKKRDRVYSDNATLELHSVDSTTAKALLEVICDRLRPTDALLLQRCADGEHLTDVIKSGDVTKLQVQRLRQRVRKELA